jgi:hypothetical protein
MNGRVAPCRPTSPASHQAGVIGFADECLARRELHLRVTLQTEIVVGLDEHFAINRAVRLMTGDAALAQRLMFVNDRFGLLSMALGTGFVQTGHRQAAGRFHDVVSMRIVALDAIHSRFNNGMMIRQIKFGVDFQMALVAACGILSGINDELASAAASLHVFASRPVA